MPYSPGVSFFVRFQELDPSSGSQCIYFTQKGSRCRNNCSLSDSTQANALRDTICAPSRQTVGLEALVHYILLKCCRAGRHRYHIENADLLVPLALRWQDEIYRYSCGTVSTNCTVCTAAHVAPLTPGAGFMTNLGAPVGSPSSYQFNSNSAFVNNASFRAETIVDSPCSMPTRSPIANQFGYQPIQMEARYNLRSREVNVPVKSTVMEMGPIKQPLSEFQPHKPNSRPADSVASKMRANLKSRDFETGSLYVFDRASSPGYVKIGWTAVSVPGRLKQWAKCGYAPNLIFSVDGVPHAKRVETLVHYQLIKEWRRERMCKGCSKSHQEWFEICKEKAMHVLWSWAKFMCDAQPYDPWGLLKTTPREIVERLSWHGELVTGQKLLECFHASAPKLSRPVMRIPWTNNTAQPGQQLKFEAAPRRTSPLLTENSSMLERITPHEGTTFLKPDPLKEISASNTEAQLKTERFLDEVSPSQAVIVKQEAPDEHITLPSSGPPVLKASPQTTPFAQNTELEELKLRLKDLEKAFLKIIDRLDNEVPMGLANSRVPTVGKNLRNEAPPPVTVIA